MLTKIVRACGKKWVLPVVVAFEPTATLSVALGGHWFYEVVGFRPPKKGEHYLSGAVVEAYRALNDLDTPFLVVVKTQKAVQRTEWVAA